MQRALVYTNALCWPARRDTVFASQILASSTTVARQRCPSRTSRLKTVRRTVSPTPLTLSGFEPLPQQKIKQSHSDEQLCLMARRKGFEPPTFWFVAKHSIQLSYRRISYCASILSHNFQKINTKFSKNLSFAEKNEKKR